MCRVIAIANQKGGVAKTTTAMNLGVGLANKGNKALLIDNDPHASLSICLGYREPDNLELTIVDVIEKIVNEEDIPEGFAILHHSENLDLLPSNIGLSAAEVSLVNVMSRELVLKDYIEQITDFNDNAEHDDAPDSLASLIRVMPNKKKADGYLNLWEGFHG